MAGAGIERAAYITERIRDHTNRVSELSDERTRIIRTLRDKHQLTYAEMAGGMGVTPQAVQKAYFRLLPEDRSKNDG